MARTTASRNPNANHAFNVVPRADIPRSSFRRSHNVKTTFNAGFLIPFFIDEAVPGDTIKLKATLFGRLNTPIWPTMDNLYLDVFWFTCAERLLWSNFKKMMGEQDNPSDSTSYIMPVVTSPANGFARGGLADYFGIPPQHSAGTGGATLSVRAGPFRMYNLVWNTWFRDENIQNSLTVPMGDGPDAESTYALVRRGKKKDYFTASLPWPQKGTAVLLPLGSTAPLVGHPGGRAVDFQMVPGGGGAASTIARSGTGAGANLIYENANATAPANDNLRWLDPGIDLSVAPSGGTTPYADLSAATAATINQIRTAFQVQRLYERDARGGTRYPEQILAHFGVTSPDARQQRPEFLGGGTLNININPVPGTNQNTEAPDKLTAPGRLGAFGTIVGGVPTVIKSFTEHSLIMGLFMIRADLNYQQGLNRMWSRSTKVDFYWPALAHLGEQAVLSKEIYVDGTAGDETVWGYQERWAEMRYKENIITGKLRSSDPQTLDAWHLAQNFTSRPLLNSTFIQETPPISRIVAVPTEPNCMLDGHIEYIHTRPMPTYSVPGLVDHF